MQNAPQRRIIAKDRFGALHVRPGVAVKTAPHGVSHT
jgi:hypothetical protein